MESANKNNKEYCRACGALLHGKFCSECGEKRFDKKDLSMQKIFLQGVDVFTHLDSKIFKSVKLLITKPGLLAKEYCSGIKVKYAKPLQLFFLINVVYFLLLSLGGFNTFTTPLNVHMNSSWHKALAKSMVEHKMEAKKITLDDYRIKFDSKVNVLSKSLVLIIAPLLSLMFGLLFITKKKTYPENFIFALSFLSWILILNIAFQSVFLLSTYTFDKLLNIDLRSFFTDDLVSIILFVLIGVYSFYAIKKFYDEKRGIAFIKALITPFGFLLVLFVYRFILFLLTYYTT
ncbi:MAG: DUF3667 domain-containing protein [Bacteroidetes bacterium]|nr:DUF3667 domain-containing protein [Bacteroidota bacterium]